MESIIEGTWGSGTPPEPFIDAILMHEYHWSEAELDATSWLRRQVCWDYLQAKWDAEADQADRTRRASAR